MGYVEIAQLVFLMLLFSIGVIGFIKAATSDDEKKK